MPKSGDVSRRPLYLQVYDWLAEEIASGTWKPNVPIPNEQELARQIGVSTGTMRKALDQMEADRLMVRKRGRGTFVVDHTSEENLQRFVNLRDQSGTRIAGTGEMLTQTVLPASPEEQSRLQLDGPEPIVATRRLRRYQGRPLLVEDRSLVVSRFPGLDAQSVGDYRIIVLAAKYGVRLTRAVEQVALLQATKEQAKLLSVETAAPLLRLDRVILANEDLPVERRVAVCNLDDGAIYVAELY